MIPSHNESYVSERQKGIFECEFCGTTTTRSFDLTRHKKSTILLQPQPVLPKRRQLSRFWNKSPLHPLVQLRKVQILSTKAQFWNRLFQRPQNDDLSRMRALLSQVTSRFNLNWKPLLLLEREVKSHPKKLLRVLKRLTFKRELKIQKKTPPRTTEVAVEEQLETAVEGVASYSTNFSSLPPIGVKVGSVEFQQHVFAKAPPATNDFDVLNVDDIRSKFCNGSPSKPVVIRQCTNKLPGIATPPAESLTSFRCVTEGIPGEVKINVCFSPIQENEDEFTLEEFLEHNEDRSLEHEYHPMNVIDFNADSKSGMVHRFCLPNIVTDISFGHCTKNSMSPKNQLAFDFTSGISDYLLMSEAGAQTNWHQDFTGTSVFYILAKGQKHFFVVEPTEENQKLFEEWLASGNRK